MRSLLSVLLLAATQAVASDGCHDVWFTRNLLFDRAGYCFGSPLGQALFDNSDCIRTSVTLSAAAKRQVDEIREIEARHGCRINTNLRSIGLNDLAIRRRLRDLPIRDEFESACIGWLGPVLSLHAGHDSSTLVIGRIEAGDTVSFAFLPVAEWTYVTTHTGDWTKVKSGGWLPPRSAGGESCRQWAG